MPFTETTPTEIIGQIIGIIAPILTVISYQMKTKKSILLVLTAATLATTIGYLLIGAMVAFLVSLFVIKFLMDFVKKHDFKVFGWYRIALGVLVIATMVIPSLIFG